MTCATAPGVVDPIDAAPEDEDDDPELPPLSRDERMMHIARIALSHRAHYRYRIVNAKGVMLASMREWHTAMQRFVCMPAGVVVESIETGRALTKPKGAAPTERDIEKATIPTPVAKPIGTPLDEDFDEVEAEL